MSPHKIRIQLTLNPKNLSDAQVLAALGLLGGDRSDVIKALALRGINMDPALTVTMGQGVTLSAEANKIKGKGFAGAKVKAKAPAAVPGKVIEPATLTAAPVSVAPAPVEVEIIHSSPAPAEPVVSSPGSVIVSTTPATAAAVDIQALVAAQLAETTPEALTADLSAPAPRPVPTYCPADDLSGF